MLQSVLSHATAISRKSKTWKTRAAREEKHVFMIKQVTLNFT